MSGEPPPQKSALWQCLDAILDEPMPPMVALDRIGHVYSEMHAHQTGITMEDVRTAGEIAMLAFQLASYINLAREPPKQHPVRCDCTKCRTVAEVHTC
jgi:hypothetical protein